MSRRRNEELREMSAEEQGLLKQIARSPSEPASHVARAKMLLAVAEGQTYQEAARAAGRKASDPVSRLVSRFNQEGLSALAPRHGGGAQLQYGTIERERILAEARRTPEREQDGTATWSLSTLQQALRQAPDGLPRVSTYTLWSVLHEAGLSWQQSRTWCETGQVKRKRKAGIVTVTDPDAEAKKT
jgi:transposase